MSRKIKVDKTLPNKQLWRRLDIYKIVMRLYAQNWSDEGIIDYLHEVCQLSEHKTCLNYINAAKAACDLRLEQYRDDVAKNNMIRLNQVITEAWEHGDHKTVLAATDQLNKMAGCYSQALEIKTDEPIKISFEE